MTSRSSTRRVTVDASAGVKDDSGAYYNPKTAPMPDLSIDDLLRTALTQIQRVLKSLGDSVASGDTSRETVQGLKDCIVMLLELKKREEEILNSLSDEKLKDYLK